MTKQSISGRAIALFTVLAMTFLGSPATATADSEWDYSLAAYLWAPKLSATTSGGAEVGVPFYKMLDNLHLGFMGRVKAQKDKWSLMSDVIYLDLEKNVNIDTNVDGTPVVGKGDASLKGWIVTPAVGYRFYDTGKSFVEIYGGARYLKLKTAADLDFENEPDFKGSESTDYWDAIVGANFTINLNKRWYFLMSADIGTGDSDRVWQAAAGFGYNFDTFKTYVGYRYLDYDFADDDPATSSLTAKGPIAGMIFYF